MMGCWETAHSLFKVVCILTTLSLVTWCYYEFNKNEDVCEVSFKKFHEDKENVYPDLTFALPNRFDETALKAYDKSFNEKTYRNFLSGGLHWNDKMLDVDFRKVSMRLADYMIESCFYKRPQDAINENCTERVIIKRTDNFGYAKFRLHFPSGVPMFASTIKLKRSIFLDGVRPGNGEFVVVVAYPNQIYQALSSGFYIWPPRTKELSKNYNMKFVLKSMDVLRRRKKKDDDCFDKEDYDGKIEGTIIEKFGCRPVTWGANRSEPLCTDKKILQEIQAEDWDQLFRLTTNKTYLEPCRTIKKFQIDYVEEDVPSGKGDDVDEGWFTIEFVIMTNTFTEVKQVRKYSIQSLVGNAGGYIGLCLGYAMWNIPTITMDIWKHVKEMHSQREFA